MLPNNQIDPRTCYIHHSWVAWFSIAPTSREGVALAVSSRCNKNPGAECAKDVGIVLCTLVADLETDLGRVDVQTLEI